MEANTAEEVPKRILLTKNNIDWDLLNKNIPGEVANLTLAEFEQENKPTEFLDQSQKPLLIAYLCYAKPPTREAVQHILDQPNVDINFAHFSGYSPLHFACLTAPPEVILLMLEWGADPLHRADRGHRPFFRYAQANYNKMDQRVVRAFLDFGAVDFASLHPSILVHIMPVLKAAKVLDLTLMAKMLPHLDKTPLRRMHKGPFQRICSYL